MAENGSTDNGVEGQDFNLENGEEEVNMDIFLLWSNAVAFVK